MTKLIHITKIEVVIIINTNSEYYLTQTLSFSKKIFSTRQTYIYHILTELLISLIIILKKYLGRIFNFKRL